MLDYITVTLGTDFTNAPLFLLRNVQEFSQLRACGVMTHEGELRTDYTVQQLGDKLVYHVRHEGAPDSIVATIRFARGSDGAFTHELEHAGDFDEPKGVRVNFAITITQSESR